MNINNTPPAHLGFLDGLRAAAAIYVMIAHCVIMSYRRYLALPDAKLAVDVFMVISGYLMMHIAIERMKREPAGSWVMARNFWIRRFFRIAPLYYVALIALFLFSPWFFEGNRALAALNPREWVGYNWAFDRSAANFFTHLTFAFGLLPSYANSTGLPDWSLGLEMQFYAVFPLLFYVLIRFGPYIGTVIIWAGVQAIFGLLGHHAYQFPEPTFLPLKMTVFLCGMLLALAHRAHGWKTWLLAGMSILVIAKSPVLGCIAFVIFLLRAPIDLGRWIRWPLKFLDNRLTRHLSDISYGIYLIHMFVISIVGGWLAKAPLSGMERLDVLLPVTMVGTYLLSVMAHRWVELPGIKLGQHINGRLFPGIAAPFQKSQPS